jgi:hypothetical protein
MLTGIADARLETENGLFADSDNFLRCEKNGSPVRKPCLYVKQQTLTKSKLNSKSTIWVRAGNTFFSKQCTKTNY